jgi:hypothetical protein
VERVTRREPRPQRDRGAKDQGRTLRDPAAQTLAVEFMTKIIVLEAFIDAMITVANEREKRIAWLEGVIRYLGEPLS